MIELKPHEERVVQEKADLDEKLVKLRDFMRKDTFATLPSEDQWLLRMQHDAMDQYSRVLGLRIARFTMAKSL